MAKQWTMALAAAVAGIWAGSASAAVLVQYNFNATDGSGNGAVSTIAANASATSLTKAAGYTNSNFSFSSLPGAYASNVLYMAPNSGATNATNAMASNSYLQFTITPANGYKLNLTDLTYSAARGGTSTPRGFNIVSSIDGYTALLVGDGTAAAGHVPTIRPTLTPFSGSLSGASFQGITTPVTFRILMYAPGTGNTAEMDNFTINGEVVAVPEPAVAAIGAMASLLVLRRKRA